jgi:hypothetical protein
VGTVRAPLAAYAAAAATLAGAAAAAHSVQLARPDARTGVAAAAAAACLALAGASALGWARTAGWAAVAVAACYAAGLGLHLGAGSDAAAPLQAIGVFLAWELGQWACELHGQADVDVSWLRGRVAFTAAQAAAAGAAGWLVLTPTAAGSSAGLALTMAGVIAAVAALGLAARLARR